MTIKYDSATIGLMNIFENISKAKVKDCFVDQNQQLVFIVEENELPKAIGKAGQNVKRFESISNKKIKLIEYNANIEKFIKNVFYPIRFESIIQEEGKEGIITIIPTDTRSRGLLIGRSAQSLRYTESIVKRYFPIKELKVQ